MSNLDLSPLATLRGECLGLAVRMLTLSEVEQIDPRDAIRLAEEYVAWVLEVRREEPAADPGVERALRRLREASTGPSDTSSKH
ncbi:MAG: hypothetical protein U1E60_00470 [Reyranellaceae bacterium]